MLITVSPLSEIADLDDGSTFSTLTEASSSRRSNRSSRSSSVSSRTASVSSRRPSGPEDDGSASDAGYQFADDNERRSSFPTTSGKKRTPAKVPKDDNDDEQADGETEQKKKRGRPRNTPNKPTSTATQNKSSAKSAGGGKGGAKRGGKSTRGVRGGKTSAADKQSEDTRDFMAFFEKASQEAVNSSNLLAPPKATRVSSLKPPAPSM